MILLTFWQIVEQDPIVIRLTSFSITDSDNLFQIRSHSFQKTSSSPVFSSPESRERKERKEESESRSAIILLHQRARQEVTHLKRGSVMLFASSGSLLKPFGRALIHSVALLLRAFIQAGC